MKLGRYAVTTIIKSTIIPILIYGLEAFPLEKSDYNILDMFLMSALSQSTHSANVSPTWDAHEQQITLPSIQVKRNKINLHLRAIRTPGCINAFLYKSFPNNFLQKEIVKIESDWNFNLQHTLDQYKGKKIIPKEAIKDLVATASDLILEQFLANTVFNDSNSPPETLPMHVGNPCKQLMQIRAGVIQTQKDTTCALCGRITANSFLHALAECTHELKVLKREKLWANIHEFDPQLEIFLKQSQPTEALHIITGLIKLKTSTANTFLVDHAAFDLCELYYDLG